MKYSIVDCATYIVKKFKDDQKEILELKLEKILYFAEAYYMVYRNRTSLFWERWLVKPYGPMNLEVHNRFKNGGLPIDKESVDYTNIKHLPKSIRKFLDTIYDVYKDTPTSELVELTHVPSSPWSRIAKNMTGIELAENNTKYISKKETKKWILEYFH